MDTRRYGWRRRVQKVRLLSRSCVVVLPYLRLQAPEEVAGTLACAAATKMKRLAQHAEPGADIGGAVLAQVVVGPRPVPG